ncbi:MAG: AI-2E family transporter [Planctomycetaceae bacterium]
MARIVSLIVLILLILFLGMTFFRVVAPFLLPLFIAGIVATLCQPLFRYFLQKTRDRPRIAAGLTTTTILLGFMVPASIGTLIAALQLGSLTSNTVANPQWRADARIKLTEYASRSAERLAPYVSGTNIREISDPAQREKAVTELTDQISLGIDNIIRDIKQKTIGTVGAAAGVAGAAAGVAAGFLGTAASLLIQGMIFIVALYYFLADGPALLAASSSLIPLHAEYQRQLLRRFEQVVRAVILSTFLAALAQGFLTAGAMWIVGFRHFFVILMISTLSSLIPLVGTWVIWGPAAVWLAINGSYGPALFLFVFGAAVIGMMDNVIRTWVLQSDAQLHPLLAFVSVLGAIQIMGLWGVFVGPVVASCLHALVKIFNIEVQELSKERFALPGIENAEKGASDVKVAPPVMPTPDSVKSEPIASSEKAPAGKTGA